MLTIRSNGVSVNRAFRTSNVRPATAPLPVHPCASLRRVVEFLRLDYLDSGLLQLVSAAETVGALALVYSRQSPASSSRRLSG